MRYLIYIFLFIGVVSNAQLYVTSSGTGSACTSGSPCSMSTAISLAGPGETIYAKAGGTYGEITTVRSGSFGYPIKIIGYKTTINDIVSTSGSTVDYADYISNGRSLSTSEMPTILGTRSSSIGTGTGITINHNYIWVENFQIRYKADGVRLNGSNNTVKNVVCADMGNFNPSDSYNPYAPSASSAFNPALPSGGTTSLSANNTGQGFNVQSGSNTFKNITSINCGMRGMLITSNNNNVDYFNITCDQNVNPTDYYYIIYGGANNTSTNISIDRIGNLTHRGHGLSMKCGANNNTYEDVDLFNTSVEINGVVYNNDFKRVYQVGGTYGGFTGGFKLDSGPYGNYFENCSTIKGEGLVFLDSSEGDCGSNVPIDAGHDNIFVNFIVGKASVDNIASIAYHWNEQGSRLTSSAYNNKFYNCTFDGSYGLYRVDRINSGNQFINCSFSNMTALRSSRFSTNSGISIGSTYSYCNTYGLGFSLTGTSMTSVNPQYDNQPSQDYDINPASALNGYGTTTSYPFDFEYNERTPGDWGVGAYKSDSSAPSDTTPPNIVNQFAYSINATYFNVDVTLDEPTTNFKIEYRESPGGSILETATDVVLRTRELFRIGGTNGNPDLTADTAYDWRAIGEDAVGNELVGDWNTTTTISDGVEPPEETVQGDLRAMYLKIIK